jgi:hypothetical protein
MKMVNTVLKTIKRRSPLILSSTAVLGVGATAYLSARASFEAGRVIWRKQFQIDRTPEPHELDLKEKAELTWKLYIPVVASGVVTCVCIIGVTRVGNKRALAAQAAFVLSERAYSEYRDKVIEEFGEKKDEKIRAAVATDRIKTNPPPSAEILITGPGNILCCEMYTGRYFSSDMETLRKAQNDLNAQMIRQDQVSMEEWYYIIGLAPTSYSSDIGWVSDKMMELEFTSVLTEDGRPCLAFTYNYHRVLYDGTCP